jgi:N-glycosylase/DNA lyase
VAKSSSLEEEALRRYFRLDDDLEAIYRSFPPDPQLAAAVARYRGMRLIRQHPWDCAVSFVCATFCHVPRIRRMVDSLCRNYGDPIDGEQFSPPRPERLAGAAERELRALGLGYRAPNVLDLARRVEDGRLDLDDLRKRPYREAVARLKEVRGIGNKVADCVALFSLDHLSAVPVDVWMERVLSARAPELRSYDDLADFARVEFGPFAGYAQQYLFHQARMETVKRDLC